MAVAELSPTGTQRVEGGGGRDRRQLAGEQLATVGAVDLRAAPLSGGLRQGEGDDARRGIGADAQRPV